MYCNKCGKEIADNALFCPYCRNQNNNRVVTDKMNLCVNCSGTGQVRKTWKIVIMAIVEFILIMFEWSLLTSPIFMYGSDGESILILFGVLITFNIWALYWGLKKSDCVVCHGRGKVRL